MRVYDLDSETGSIYTSPQNFGLFADYSLAAILCYRLVESKRVPFLREQVQSIVKEFQQFEIPHSNLWYPAHQGLCDEILGDVVIYSGESGAIEHYDAAFKIYENTENHLGWQSEFEFDFLIQPPVSLADQVGVELTQRKREEVTRTDLCSRISWKKEYLSEIIRDTLAQGEIKRGIF
ncbi:hypothetical protein SAMN04487950_3838 [Halogranum rubrum]|uniref:Uncharacterized protein n=2 Tax=Halogranum rubrum TaxID=553466 RepID=A0A1I4HTY7_9EURY|nr:hypothetical protein SAMN04487950_3838 [Halogranum rubrum]